MSPLAHDGSDATLLACLRAGDERAFAEVVQRYHGALLHVALQYVSSRAVAEEVVQETWLGVVRGLDRFEGRSSFKTWLFRILANVAQTRGAKEARSVPFSALAESRDGDERAVEPDRFREQGHRWAGHWATAPRALAEYPEAKVESDETLAAVHSAIRRLPVAQQRVIWLRDVEGWAADEVCSMLDVTEANQRVLLHRARSRVRASLEAHLETGRR